MPDGYSFREIPVRNADNYAVARALVELAKPPKHHMPSASDPVDIYFLDADSSISALRLDEPDVVVCRANNRDGCPWFRIEYKKGRIDESLFDQIEGHIRKQRARRAAA